MSESLQKVPTVILMWPPGLCSYLLVVVYCLFVYLLVIDGSVFCLINPSVMQMVLKMTH